MRVDTRPHDQLRGRQVALGTAGHRAPMGCDAPEPMGLGEREWFHSLQVDAPGEQGPALGSSPASCPCASISPGESLGRELGLLRSWAALEVGSGQTWGCQASPHILPERGGSGLCPIPRQRELGKEQAEGKQGGPAWSQPSRSRPQGTVPPHRPQGRPWRGCDTVSEPRLGGERKGSHQGCLDGCGQSCFLGSQHSSQGGAACPASPLSYTSARDPKAGPHWVGGKPCAQISDLRDKNGRLLG